MKILKNKTYSLKGEGDKEATTVSLIKFCIHVPVQGGFSLSDVRNRLRIEAACDNTGDEIKLEDADVANLKSIVNEVRWYTVHSDIVDFCDEINKL